MRAPSRVARSQSAVRRQAAAAAFTVFLGLLASAAPAPIRAQTPAGTVEQIEVHSPSLEGNLQGNPAERDVFVYLPPSYNGDQRRRYPVVYQLHGWLPGGEQWSGMIDLQGATDRAIASGAAREMIVVVPDALTVFGGSSRASTR